MMTSKYFNMGTVVVTNGINEAMTESNQFKLEVFYALDSYSNKNWGILCECHSANYLEAFLSVYLETNSGSNSVMGILNYCCPAK